jgi:hypothetical protein
MTNLKVFKLSATGQCLEEQTLSSIKQIPEATIHPHSFHHLERGRDVLFRTDELKEISKLLKNQGTDADIVNVGIGDPTCCREGEAIDQIVVIAPKGQRRLRTKTL